MSSLQGSTASEAEEDEEEKAGPKKRRSLLTFSKSKRKKRRVYLSHYLRDHGIWQESYRWETWIQSVLEQKLQDHDFHTE